MTLRSLFLTLLFLGAAIAQDDTPILLTGKDAAIVCHGKTKHAPGCVTPPEPTYQFGPGVPEHLKARQGGTVRLTLVIGTNGLPHNVRVDRSLNSESDEEAMNSVEKWKFKPAIKDGKPVPVQINVEVAFRYR